MAEMGAVVNISPQEILFLWYSDVGAYYSLGFDMLARPAMALDRVASSA